MGSIAHFLRNKDAVVSIEVALIFPVILFILMMFFELARIALVISLVDVSIEQSVQSFREDALFNTLTEEEIKTTTSENIIAHSFNMIHEDSIQIELQRFSNLNEFADVKESENTYYSLPILNFSVYLNENFITPLPQFFGLGDSFQHEYRHVLGDLLGDEA
ncbi:TadE/TadG family type IV pilus assembly protein [Marinomonas mediterranea]|uniref:TadE/TadG family type IV pilus assembly protein n=1 Tax=Marinomonas mediterranea TaxID=119864 RepID=UPI00234BDE92|nr:TadE family protein [Marinomonas mediterranea]WCN11208.1 pilus assembly protein [Marinomonas mediterranea]